MEKRSAHYGDIKKWIEKVINSCETYEQAWSARRLVWNFEKQMIKNETGFHIRFYIKNDLNYLVNNKMNELLEK